MKIQSNSSRCWLPALAWQKPIISTLCIVIAAMFTLVVTAQEPNPAPPQVYIDTTWNPPIQGGTWTVNSSSTFQLALNMAKIVTPNGSPALNPLPGANHYRLVGLEVTTASNQGCIPNNVPPVNCF